MPERVNIPIQNAPGVIVELRIGVGADGMWRSGFTVQEGKQVDGTHATLRETDAGVSTRDLALYAAAKAVLQAVDPFDVPGMVSHNGKQIRLAIEAFIAAIGAPAEPAIDKRAGKGGGK